MSKYLDLAGLTAYDKKIKEWIKSGTVDITDDAIRALFVTVAEGPANNEIWYTSSDEDVVNPATSAFGVNIVSNTYEDGKGVITFDGDITSIGNLAFDTRYDLTSITIPNSVTSIGDYAFGECYDLNYITFEGTIEEWNSITKEYTWKKNVPATYVQCTDGQVPL
jgi:hypothetical protein